MGKDCTDDMITSSANQQMKHLSQLMKRAKERKKEQVFVVEEIFGVALQRHQIQTAI